MAVRLWFVFLLLPTVLNAQHRNWQLETHSMEAAMGAVLTNPSGRMKIYCGKVLSNDTSLNEEIAYPGPDHFYLVIPEDVGGAPDAASNGEQNIGAFSGELSVELPPFYFDDVNGKGWISRVPFDHPFVSMVMQGQEVGIMPQLAFETYLYLEGFAQGLTGMMDHCGNSAETATEAPVQSGEIDPALFGLIQTQAFSQCQASYTLPPTAYTQADVTGDGVHDVVVDFGQLKCTGGIFANAPTKISCTGEMCRHDIYSSQSATPMILYGKNLAPAPDRIGDILLTMDQPSCEAMSAKDGCKVRMRWMMQTFGTVGLE